MKIQCLLQSPTPTYIYKTDCTASTHRKPIKYCAIRNQKGKEQRKKLKLTCGPEIDLCVQPSDNNLYIE